MARKYFKQAPISLVVQKADIERRYDGLVDSCSISKNLLTCYISLQPSNESIKYRIKIAYKISDYAPKAWLVSPELEKKNGKFPHHIYEWDNGNHPRLCVYYPRYREWNPHMLLSTSFIPWIITWLNTYEYWLITGVWNYDESMSTVKK